METAYGNNIKKYFLLPKSLYEKADELGEKLGMNFSQLMRTALEKYVEQMEKEKVNNEIAEACKFYYDIDKKIADEWRPAEGGL